MFTTFLIDDTAQGHVEYALVISLVSLAAVAAMKFLGKRTKSSLRNGAAYLK